MGIRIDGVGSGNRKDWESSEMGRGMPETSTRRYPAHEDLPVFIDLIRDPSPWLLPR